MHSVEVGKQARRFFERSNAALQRRLDKCFDRLKEEPHDGGNIKRLSGNLTEFYRYRVGDYRVIYRIDEPNQIVQIVRIAHRSEAYE